ncbi:hypothetical protein ABZ297_36505 [Nonomuraea sp. NPDC005983]|uniref:hypothetical protein n=1 Tax=Nonomuraea sp. NPDC005983 TaxID=3155595 RepID=UPI0033B7BA48
MAEASRDQLHVQQRANKVLEQLLARIANEKLPVISWTIASDASGAALTGRCDAEDMSQRREDFEAWREALGVSDQPVEEAFEGGIRLRASVQDNYADLSVALVADIAG